MHGAPTDVQLQVQAAVLDATDVLVAGHGAMIALFVFLPRRSVIVDISSAAPHRQMNVHAAKTLMHLKLQTVSVSGSHAAEQRANLRRLPARDVTSLRARLDGARELLTCVHRLASSRQRWICSSLQPAGHSGQAAAGGPQPGGAGRRHRLPDVE
jgi:hypothetical protein